jgi:DNA polymerase III alpha subunit
MGLNQVRDLTRRTIQSILRCQPFHTLEEFLVRVDPQPKEAQHLAMCGALEGLATIPQALARIEHKRPPGQLQLFNPGTELEDWSDEQRWSAQQEILGVSLGISPLEQWAESILASGAITTLEAEGRTGEKVMVAGMRQTWRRLRSRSNELMATLNLEDLEGSLQVFIPPRLYRHRSQHLQEQGPFLIEGIIEFDANRQQTHMVAEDITLLQ